MAIPARWCSGTIAEFDLGPISRDKRYLALIKSHTTSDSDVHVFDSQTKKVMHSTPHTGNVAFAPAAFTPHSRRTAAARRRRTVAGCSS